MEFLYSSISNAISKRFSNAKAIPNSTQSAANGPTIFNFIIPSIRPVAITLELHPAEPTLLVKIFPAINDLERQIFDIIPSLSSDSIQFSQQKSRIFVINKVPTSDDFKVYFMTFFPDGELEELMSRGKIVSEIVSLLAESSFGRDF